jgi:hypothetical protein
MRLLLSGLEEEEKSTFLSLFEKAMDAAETDAESLSDGDIGVHSFAKADEV